MDLTTDAFINALRRFLSRRSPVLHFFSDNGTNFVSAEKTLREALHQWNQHKIKDFLLQKEIQWTFNPPNASHMVGAWERMIRSVRRILTSLMKERTLDGGSEVRRPFINCAWWFPRILMLCRGRTLVIPQLM